MSHLIDALLQRGYRVVSYDALRHGKSKAKRADLADWAKSVQAVLAHIGHVQCIAAYSFGAAAVTVASKQGLDTDKLLFFAPIHDVVSVSNDFANELCIPDGVATLMRQYTWHKNRENFESFGKSWEDLFHTTLRVPTLIFHDINDKRIPITHSEKLSSRWPWTILVKTEGLGHRKILDDESVIEQSCRFIDEKS